MCGIAGLVDLDRSTPAEELERVTRLMIDLLAHRGPDSSGVWVDAESGIALGHRRLAILDLSPLGHQPMASRSGRYTITYNGEIYNFKELRRRLEAAGARFAGGSDTEVLLEAVTQWGLEETLARLNGMFAFALWDRHERRLTLARDRIGEKPLVWGIVGRTLVFASELRSIPPAISRRGGELSLDPGSVSLFFRFGYVPAPHTMYQEVHKVEPATAVSIDLSTPDHRVSVKRYWSVASVVEAAVASPVRGSDTDLADELDERLRTSVGLRMVSDVPLGAFLSGGVDSATVVSVMRALGQGPVRTFTIGFGDAAFNEAPAAARLARHLGTEHTELLLTSSDAMAVVPDLGRMYDEPFADSSQIPTYLVSKLARETVTVSLSGDGGDELFGGYNRYLMGERVRRLSSCMPWPVRRSVGRAITRPSAEQWDHWMSGPLLRRTLGRRANGEQLHKLATAVGAADADALYRGLVSFWPNPGLVVHGDCEPATVLSQPPAAGASDFVSRMMYLDTVTYLPDDILVKLDRASMAHGLESRVPLLDPDLVAFAWRLPHRLRAGSGRGGAGKVLLRRVLARYVPAEYVGGPKRGFAIPLGAWLREPPLRDWAEDLLATSRLDRSGLLETSVIRAAWAEHLNGSGSRHHQLWVVLMFQAWLAANVPYPATVPPVRL